MAWLHAQHQEQVLCAQNQSCTDVTGYNTGKHCPRRLSFSTCLVLNFFFLLFHVPKHFYYCQDYHVPIQITAQRLRCSENTLLLGAGFSPRARTSWCFICTGGQQTQQIAGIRNEGQHVWKGSLGVVSGQHNRLLSGISVLST